MKTRKLGGSGIDITEIGLGTNYIGGHNLYETVDEDEGVRIVKRALDIGITFIDTADVYGLGRSEELVGKALEGRRHEAVLATKGGIVYDGTSRGVDNDPSYLRRALETSLKRLNCEYVDLYYIHRADGKTPPEDSFGALMKFKEEGLIRAAGVSNFEINDLKEAQKAGPIDALQSRFNLLQREVETEILPFCEQHRISFIPWGPLAFGLFGGKYTRDFKLAQNDWRHRSGVFDAEVFGKNLDIVAKLKDMAAARGAAVAHMALQWLLSRPAAGSVIAGAKRLEQVEENARADSLELTEAEIEQISTLAEITG